MHYSDFLNKIFDGTSAIYHRAASQVVTPAAQASTDTYADVAGSTLDTLGYQSVAYTCVNAHATRVLHWKVIGGNDSAFADAVTVQAEADIAGTAVANYSATVAVWRYYKVQIQSQDSGLACNATVRGICKG